MVKAELAKIQAESEFDNYQQKQIIRFLSGFDKLNNVAKK